MDLAEDCALFIDLDLSILGAEPPLFDAYDAAIRREFAHVPETVYNSGRRTVLERFLNRQRLYLTDAIATRREDQARANLKRALARLT